MESIPAYDTVQPQPAPTLSLRRHGDFLRLWGGQTISLLGSTITREALPYTAILTLQATPIQVALLGAASMAPVLLLGLVAGVWVDRLRRRPIMIIADLGRALLLLSIPLAYLYGMLHMWQLYLVATLAGILTIFFDVAYQAYVPSLVAREQLVDANSRLGASNAIAEIAGPSIGGMLVQFANGPLTLLLDAGSFLISAVTLWRIRAVEPQSAAPGEQRELVQELLTGVRAIWAQPLLRLLALGILVTSFFGWFFGAIYGLYALRTLGMNPAALGLTVACGGVGSLLGALLATPLARRMGVGPTIGAGLLLSATLHGVIWLAGAAPQYALPLLGIAQLLGDMGQTAGFITILSVQQAITPDRLLGRVNAGMSVLGDGIGALGMLTGGILAETIGLRPTVAIATIGTIAGAMLLLRAPLRRLRQLPAPA